jgi:hypothetical protein
MNKDTDEEERRSRKAAIARAFALPPNDYEIAARQGIAITKVTPIQHYGRRQLSLHIRVLSEAGKYLAKYDPQELRELKSVCDKLSKKIDSHLSTERKVVWLPPKEPNT